MTTKAKNSGGGSDANVINEHGIPAIVLGQGYSGMHTEQEQISKESLYRMAELLEALVMQVAGRTK